MSEVKFKYSDSFLTIIERMRKDNIAEKLIEVEDQNSNNLIDITDKKQFLKCVIDSHTQNIRCGKVIKRILPNSDSVEVELFVNKFRSSIFNCTFSIVEGENIKAYYNKGLYYQDAESNCSLYGSCMNDKEHTYFDLYAKNDVRLVVLTDNDTNKVLGRALLWDKVNNLDVSVMDTPYVAFQSLFYKFKEFAEENNFFFTQDLYGEDLFVNLKETEFKHYPYCDTFITLNPDNTLVNSPVDYDDQDLVDGNVYRVFQQTDGEPEIHKGYQYFSSIDDQVGQYTFDYKKVSRCKFDNRSYLIDDMTKHGFNSYVHKAYKSLIDNAEKHISNMLDFSDEKMKNLFLFTVKKKMKKIQNRLNRVQLFDLRQSNIFDFEHHILENIVLGKREREIVVPVKFYRKGGWSFDSKDVTKLNCFMKFKIMPSGIKVGLVESVTKKRTMTYNLPSGPYTQKWEEESLGKKTFYQMRKPTSLKYFFNNTINEMKSDISRLIH